MNRALKPLENIHKLLISTPARFVGEFASDQLLITHAWPAIFGIPTNSSHLQGVSTPISRSYFAIVFTAAPPNDTKKPLRIRPSYEHIPDILCIYLAILFGKRFDSHGMLETDGFFRIPNFATATPVHYRGFGFASKDPRAHFPIPLKLDEFQHISSLVLDDRHDVPSRDRLLTAGRYYLRALRTVEQDPEGAFIDLITCIEVLSEHFSFKETALFDSATLKMLEKIESGPDGKKVVRQVRSRLRQIKRRYVLTVMNLLSERLFDGHEGLGSTHHLELDGLERRLSAAYDVRSLHLHTGAAFETSIAISHNITEVPIGAYVLRSKKFADALAKSPTFIGMERIVHLCLLRFAHLHVASIHPMLDGPGLPGK